MLDFSATNIQKLAITYVGNKAKYEGVSIPRTTLTPLHDFAHEILLPVFLRPFEKTEEFFYFHHLDDVSNNQTFQHCMAIFEDPDRLPEVAAKLTAQLYESMLAPRSNGGELLVAYFDALDLNGEKTPAVGIFKVNSRDPFLKIERSEEAFRLNVLEGIPTAKAETAALIFQMDESEGYRVCAIDSVSKKGEISFWKDDFLQIRPIEDGFYNTRHYMSLAGEFIAQQAPRKFGLDRGDQMELMYRTSNYFKDNETFEIDDFSKQVFPDSEEAQAALKSYREEYSKQNSVPLEDQFDISPQAVKRENKIFKSVIKLDKNFHIYVHGRRDLIERGFDEEKGKKFYKVFYEDEA